MAWEIKDISVNDIRLQSRPKEKYHDVYEKIQTLRVGDGFVVKTETTLDATNMRNAVSNWLKKKKMSDKYIASNRLNKFYCGRIK